MSMYVLVHGSWHGAWCWGRVIPLLKKEGHKVEAIDLPGHGSDKTPIAQITLQAYTDRVCQALDSCSEPAILVGHSMGGVIISQAAEYRPEKIRTLVYLSAFLLSNGETLLQAQEGDKETMIPANLILSDDQSYGLIREEAIKEIFYGRCPDEDAVRAQSLLVPQAVAPCATPIAVTPENFGRIPRVYIECLQDKAVSPPFQKQMYTAVPCQKVISMDTDHSPFYSAPEELAARLLSL